jgi:hypothetical protein
MSAPNEASITLGITDENQLLTNLIVDDRIVNNNLLKRSAVRTTKLGGSEEVAQAREVVPDEF